MKSLDEEQLEELGDQVAEKLDELIADLSVEEALTVVEQVASSVSGCRNGLAADLARQS